jgi:hypothetical protein
MVRLSALSSTCSTTRLEEIIFADFSASRQRGDPLDLPTQLDFLFKQGISSLAVFCALIWEMDVAAASRNPGESAACITTERLIMASVVELEAGLISERTRAAFESSQGKRWIYLISVATQV